METVDDSLVWSGMDQWTRQTNSTGGPCVLVGVGFHRSGVELF